MARGLGPPPLGKRIRCGYRRCSPSDVEVYGIRLIGVDRDTVTRLALTATAIGAVLLLRFLLGLAVRALARGQSGTRVAFWVRQALNLTALAIVIAAVLSIWFDDAARLTTVAGFATAGLAIAAQRAVTAFAGYLVIMRGNTFTIGDRIKMGGVRGDVIALGFLQTRILEMGQPPDVNQQEDPGMWVRARQYSGRVVTVTNDRVFDEPIFNFTRELPYIWEEISVGVGYHVDRAQAERILLDAARALTGAYAEESRDARARFEGRYHVRLDREDPQVYWRLTDNWLELTVRFLVPEHGIRGVKNAMTRRILPELEKAGIEIASATFEIVGIPPLRLARRGSDR